MYLDSCILVKLFVVEPDSDYFLAALEGQSLVTSELAFPEVFSAMLARERAGRISASERNLAWQECERRAELGEIRVENLTSITMRKAISSLRQCHPDVPLRTLDALHLATAELCQEFPLATTDKRLRDAAQMLGIEVFPPLDARG